MIKPIIYPNAQALKKALQRNISSDESVLSAVDNIYKQILNVGERALFDYTLQFDKVDLKSFRVDRKEIDQAKEAVSNELKNAINQAKLNITAFHKAQRPQSIEVETMPGIKCFTRNVPIQSVGLYIPGGSAPLFSSVLMLAIPAKIAGCPTVALCTPPASDGSVNPAILYTADLCGIDTIYKIGGAQAIIAMTLGIGEIPEVDKIFGPGNAYVTQAKQLASRLGKAIDMPAGPSEVMVLADPSARADVVAADMLAQMEHGPDSQAICLTTSTLLATEIVQQLQDISRALPRLPIISDAALNSSVIVLKDREEIVKVANDYAAEHLIINMDDPYSIADQITNAGSVFIGPYSSESAGDYASGTNHTLPTYGYAKAYSGVNLSSFYKQITYQEITRAGAESLTPTIIKMAEAEQLHAHALAAKIRIDKP